jgi:hypothetical protein
MPPSMKLALGALALAGLCAAAACQAPAPNSAANTTNAAATNAPATNAATAAAPSDAADAADAKAFLVGLYAHYQTNKNNNFNMFDTNSSAVFDPDTLALLRADTKALKGDLGEIDGDWLCDCQDFTSIQATVNVTSATPTTAEATADFHDTVDPRPSERDTFDLVKVNGAWRIHDMSTPGQPPLRKTLQDEIQSLTHGGAGNSARAIDDAP